MSVMFMLDPFILPRLEGIASYAREHEWKLFPEDRVGDDADLRLFDGAICSLRGKRHQLNRVCALQNGHIHVKARQFARHRAADHARADDDDIRFHLASHIPPGPRCLPTR